MTPNHKILLNEKLLNGHFFQRLNEISMAGPCFNPQVTKDTKFRRFFPFFFLLPRFFNVKSQWWNDSIIQKVLTSPRIVFFVSLHIFKSWFYTHQNFYLPTLNLCGQKKLLVQLVALLNVFELKVFDLAKTFKS